MKSKLTIKLLAVLVFAVVLASLVPVPVLAGQIPKTAEELFIESPVCILTNLPRAIARTVTGGNNIILWIVLINVVGGSLYVLSKKGK